MERRIESPVRKPAVLPWLVLMFLFACNFISAGGYLLFFLMAAYSVFHLREFSFRSTEIFLFLFGVEYFLFYVLWYRDVSFREVCNYLIAPWLLHWIGRSMALRYRRENLPMQIATALCLGFFACGTLCIVYSLSFAPPAMGARILYKFWDRTAMSVTSGGLLFPMAIGLSLGHLTVKNSLRTKLFWAAVLGVSIYYAFTWAHRTTVYILAILLVWNFLARLLSADTPPVKKAALVTGTLLAVLIAALCLMTDAGGCRSWLQGQWLYRRLTDPAAANSSARWKIWREFFSQWLRYPLGGSQVPISSSFVHNLWLDVYYLCGAVPFAALVIATGLIARNLFRCRRILPERSGHILTSCYIAVFLAFLVEPVLSAYPYIVLAVLLLSGSLEGTATAPPQN